MFARLAIGVAKDNDHFNGIIRRPQGCILSGGEFANSISRDRVHQTLRIAEMMPGTAGRPTHAELVSVPFSEKSGAFLDQGLGQVVLMFGLTSQPAFFHAARKSIRHLLTQSDH